MARVGECIALIKPLFEAVLDNADEKEVGKIAKKISKREHDADIIKNKIRQNLPGGLFLPVNREDLLAYLKTQDDIADAVEDVAVLLTLRRIEIPESLKPDLREFVDKVLEVCSLCEDAEAEMERLVSSGFGQAERDRIFGIVATAEHAEWEADKAQVKAAKNLLSLEGVMSPVDVMLMFQVFGMLGKVANYAEKTGDRLRRLLVKG